MKVTGLSMLLIGLVITIYCTILLVTGQDPTYWREPDRLSVQRDLEVLFVFGSASVVAGVLMALYGGRGYSVTKNPELGHS